MKAEDLLGLDPEDQFNAIQSGKVDLTGIAAEVLGKILVNIVGGIAAGKGRTRQMVTELAGSVDILRKQVEDLTKQNTELKNQFTQFLINQSK